MESVIEPALDSIAGNIEIAIYMTVEIEEALTSIYCVLKSGSIINHVNSKLTEVSDCLS